MANEPEDPRAAARQSYERKMAYPLFVVSLMFIVGMVLAFDAQSTSQHLLAGRVLIFISWIVFAADYVIGFVLAARRHQYFATHIIQLVGILFPPVRILLFGRVFTVLNSSAKRRIGKRVRIYALYLTTLLIVLASVAEALFERAAPDANIKSLGDAFWWATETVSTVGYGDYYPVTNGGKIVAILLFVNGIALLSAVTATIATKVLEGELDGDDVTDEVSLVDLRDRLQTMEQHLAALVESAGSAAPNEGQLRGGERPPEAGG